MAAGWLLAGCDGRTTEEVIPASGCRLENYTFARGQPGSGGSYVNEQATYTYDARGNLLRADTVVHGGEASYTYQRQMTSRYTYDAEGFLSSHVSARNQRYTHSDGNTETLQQSLNIAYTYADGRLSGYVSLHSLSRNISLDGTGVKKGATTRVQGSYAYDATGNLLTYTTRRTYDDLPPAGDGRPLDAEGTEMTWVYRNDQLADVIQKTGGIETRPATIVNGLVTRMNAYGGYCRNEYDGRDRLIRSEEYQDDQLIATNVQEWADGRPASDALPGYKGFPDPKPAYGRRGVLRRQHATWGVPGSGIRSDAEFTYFHQFNAQGFVTAVTSEGRRLVDPGRNAYQSEGTPEPTVFTYRCR
ncbi:MAG: hypothetical protein AVDCRST_MAG56-3272 [uncultured Cytophagales bacterium]|uniref:Rhs-family protein n=1 Tax=uncultured Cytophagales bacterium TaxID=158755 RepID=A0A6J4JBU2_9SPHI|nr:MAG: hypothetical protein AVDCRST_MAG56-3272 [uncultured Cytophagales bacterium]